MGALSFVFVFLHFCTAPPHNNSLSLSLFHALVTVIIMFARGRRRTDEENEEDEKEEESASVGTAFGKIWECYCAFYFVCLFSSLCAFGSLSVLVFGKNVKLTKSFL